MKLEKIKPGIRIRTKLKSSSIRPPPGIRRSNIEGVIISDVCGYDRSVWWVDHDDGTIGSYHFTEMEEIK